MISKIHQVKKFYSRVSINRFAFACVCTNMLNNIQETGNSWQRGVEIVWQKDLGEEFLLYIKYLFFKISETTISSTENKIDKRSIRKNLKIIL